MPVNKEAFIRYRLIDQCINDKNHPYPDMDDLIFYCQRHLGKDFSVSTIQKDIKSMKEDPLLGFKAPIKYSRKHMGYYYDDEDYTIHAIRLNIDNIASINMAASILHQYKGLGVFEYFDDAVDKIYQAIHIHSVLDYYKQDEIIQLERKVVSRGDKHLPILIKAIQERKIIEFNYIKFSDTTPKFHCVHPYLIKEYMARWYLIGFLPKHESITIYGLDRITDLCVTRKDFSKRYDFDEKKYFKYAYGITVFQGEVYDVILSFTSYQGKYVKSKPLHHTQKVVEEHSDRLVIGLRVGVTIELIMDILKYGNQVEVLAPAFLREEIKGRLIKASKQYED